MSFGIKDFTPEQLRKWQTLNPNLLIDLGIEEPISEQDFLLAERELKKSWDRLEIAYKANTEATERLERAKKGPPLATPVQLLGALIFLVILIRIIGGG